MPNTFGLFLFGRNAQRVKNGFGFCVSVISMDYDKVRCEERARKLLPLAVNSTFDRTSVTLSAMAPCQKTTGHPDELKMLCVSFVRKEETTDDGHTVVMWWELESIKELDTLIDDLI